MSNHSHCYHLKHEPHALIDCVQAQCEGQGPYPVLRLGEVSIFPSHEQLVMTRDVIDGYLTRTPHCDVKPFTQEETAKIAAGIEAEERATVAEPYGARCGNCNARYTSTWIGTACSVCDGTIIPPQALELTDAEVQEMF